MSQGGWLEPATHVDGTPPDDNTPSENYICGVDGVSPRYSSLKDGKVCRYPRIGTRYIRPTCQNDREIERQDARGNPREF